MFLSCAHRDDLSRGGSCTIAFHTRAENFHKIKKAGLTGQVCLIYLGPRMANNFTPTSKGACGRYPIGSDGQNFYLCAVLQAIWTGPDLTLAFLSSRPWSVPDCWDDFADQ